MDDRVRQCLLWGGLAVMALGAGTVLGRFTVSGLGGVHAPMNEMQQLQAFTAQQKREAERRLQKSEAAANPSIPDSPGVHVCQGCDAHLYGNTAMAALTTGDDQDASDDADDEPADDD